MEIRHKAPVVWTQAIALALAALLAVALALAVGRVVVDGNVPSAASGATTAAPVHLPAPDAQDRNEQLRQPVEQPGGGETRWTP